MLIKVKVKTKSKKDSVEKISEDRFLVETSAKPERGSANKEVLNLLSEFLGIERKRLKIIKGSRERNKIVKIVR